jgi:hypothetical protein
VLVSHFYTYWFLIGNNVMNVLGLIMYHFGL